LNEKPTKQDLELLKENEFIISVIKDFLKNYLSKMSINLKISILKRLLIVD
jgi:hypothetical protein